MDDPTKTTETGIVRRNDSFDIGTERAVSRTRDDDIIRIAQNPGELVNLLNLTSKQESNVRSLIVGAGTGGIHRLLSQHLGDEVAGALGGLLSGYVAGKLFKRSGKNNVENQD